jgi:hypothetical protein
MGMAGRNIFVTDLATVLRPMGPKATAAKARDARFTAVWIRVGRGATADPNLGLADLPKLKGELDRAGIGLWGWHVPFCADRTAARNEVAKVLGWADQHSLDGIVVDAERTRESPRFRGGAAEAELYAETLAQGLAGKGRAIALSSHDQPSLHQDLPFAAFLQHIDDICPQIYYRSTSVSPRFKKSVRDYQALVPANSFKARFKPTGNITISDDLPLPDVASCLTAAQRFMALVKEGGFAAYSFWSWDSAPDEIFDLLRDTPV